MGLFSAPGAFQNMVELILAGLSNEVALIHLDGIKFFGKSFGEHLSRLELVFCRIKEAGLKIKRSKCIWEPKNEVPIFKGVFDGLFTEKQLEESRLAQMYRHSRKTITRREVFLGQNGKYSHEQLLDFNTYKSDSNWHQVFWIKPIGKNILKVWHLVRELTLTLMTLFLIAKILVICLRTILSTTLFLKGAQPRLALQPINPLMEPNYITVLKNQQLKQKQVSKKVVKTKVSDLLGTDKTVFEPGAVIQEKTYLFQLENFSTFMLLNMSNIDFV